MATLEQLINEVRALSPAEKLKLRKALDSDLAETPAAHSRASETDWVDRHRSEYLGQWVAVEDDRLIAHGTNPRQVYLAARAAGVNTPFIVRVHEREEPFTGGWL
jgi:hypothetical protein